MRRSFCCVLALALCIAVLPERTSADTITIDFEGYALGAIPNGFQGWQITNPGWDQAVTNVAPISGAQSWRISSLVGSGSFGDHPFSPALSQAAGESTTGAPTNFFTASMDFRPLASNTVGDGVTISIDRGDGARGNWMRIDNTAAGWELQAFDYDGSAFVFSTLASLTDDQIYNLRFDMTFVDGLQNDIWNIYLDNALLFTGVGWEDFFVDFQPGNNPPFAYDRLLFRNASPLSGSVGVLFDNLTYSSGLAAVPEPASLAVWSLAGIAALCGARRRRKDSAA